MTPDDRFFVIVGRAMCVISLAFVLALALYTVAQLYHADQSYLHDTTPLLPPDSSGIKHKTVKATPSPERTK